jgi:hypothetical protein
VACLSFEPKTRAASFTPRPSHSSRANQSQHLVIFHSRLRFIFTSHSLEEELVAEQHHCIILDCVEGSRVDGRRLTYC